MRSRRQDLSTLNRAPQPVQPTIRRNTRRTTRQQRNHINHMQRNVALLRLNNRNHRPLQNRSTKINRTSVSHTRHTRPKIRYRMTPNRPLPRPKGHSSQRISHITAQTRAERHQQSRHHQNSRVKSTHNRLGNRNPARKITRRIRKSTTIRTSISRVNRDPHVALQPMITIPEQQQRTRTK